MLLGRAAERDLISGLIARARAGASGVLVVRGEPGIGKTALLDEVAATTPGATILRARGVESEVELAFAGLHELLSPALHALPRVPAPQAAALRAALGLESGAAAERHLVGAATLALLAALAEERPVLALIDDVQWFDAPSAGAITFAARRLLADSVTIVFTLRAGETSPIEGGGFDELALGGLGPEDARALLAASAGRPMAADTADWLHAATGGNPLALVELAPDAPRLPPGPVVSQPPLGPRLERALGRRLERVPAAGRAAMLAAAVADTEEATPVLRAAQALGGTLEGLEAAEAETLVTLAAGRVAFRHPLIRSVVLASASASERRAAHRAYAAVLEPGDRRAWHAAAGAIEPDEAIAAALAATAEDATGRGGHAAATAAFEHAARLTPDPAERARRLLRAADAAWLAGDAPRAVGLLDDAGPLPEAAHLRGRVLARHGPVPQAVAVLRDGAERIAARAPGEASTMLAEAAYATVYASVGDEMDVLAARAVELAPADDPRATCLAALALGAALALRGDAAATEWLHEASELIDTTPELREDPRLAALLGVPAAFLRAGPEGYEPAARAVRLARERGAVGVLPSALFYVGTGALGNGRWTEAAASFDESVRLAEEAGLPVDAVGSHAGLARLEARRGHAARAAASARHVLAQQSDLAMPFFQAWAHHAEGEIAWAEGDAEGAVAAFEAKQRVLTESRIGDPDQSPAPELAEVLMALGRVAEAAGQAAAAAAGAEAKGRPWALARARRAEALALADDEAALQRFGAALALHERETDVFERARTQLCFGERLRRTGRRADARTPLREALDAFEALGATPWAGRAAAELRATGETVRRRDPSTLDELTPQELRIAVMLGEGATTRQAAASLYLSPKTVEYHLRHVYMKLGVNSRAGLAGALRAGSLEPPGPATVRG
jgi:DNA-binding CsgD family transcriptional regulator